MTNPLPPCTTETESELMRRVASGDARAFEAIYDRYQGQAYSLARAITGHVGGAEEATQDAFLALWRGAATFDERRARLSTWLLSLVRYRSIDWTRRAASRGSHQDIDDGLAERIASPERTEEQVLAIDEHDRARLLVDGLPPDQREVIDLAYFAGFTQTEIAARIGIPLGTVKGRARLGLLRLRAVAEHEPALAQPA